MVTRNGCTIGREIDCYVEFLFVFAQLGQTVEPEPSHRYKKRKPKPFALLRPSKKKKKKHGRAAVVPLPATISDGSK